MAQVLCSVCIYCNTHIASNFGHGRKGGIKLEAMRHSDIVGELPIVVNLTHSLACKQIPIVIYKYIQYM